LKETLEGLNYLHMANDKMHRDIKAGNIFLNSEGEIFLGDYGVSESIKLSKSQDIAGTPSWMAPEVCSQLGHDSKADIWSIGITAIEMAEGVVPWFDLEPQQILSKIINADKPPKLKPTQWSQEF